MSSTHLTPLPEPLREKLAQAFVDEFNHWENGFSIEDGERAVALVERVLGGSGGSEGAGELLAHFRDERARLTADLAECYRISGADPDGDSDEHLAKHAVQAVKELREECTEEGERADRLQATLDALVGDDAVEAAVAAVYRPAYRNAIKRQSVRRAIQAALAAAKKQVEPGGRNR